MDRRSFTKAGFTDVWPERSHRRASARFMLSYCHLEVHTKVCIFILHGALTITECSWFYPATSPLSETQVDVSA